MHTYWGFVNGYFKTQFEARNFDEALDTFKSWFTSYEAQGRVLDYFVVDTGRVE